MSLCDFCHRRTACQRHHVTQGFRFKAVDDERFILDLCLDCHNAIHLGMFGEHSRAIGLALLASLGRGSVREFWKLIGKNWPREELVLHWQDRLRLTHRS